jgi:pimeloyl-ACP methyl ester carboxylesterase
LSTSKDIDAISRPPAIFAACEVLRAGLEGFGLMLSGPLLAAAPRGDGHGVLVIPGFATTDSSTAVLRSFLEALGYTVHPWRLGWNLDHRTAGHGGEHVTRQIDRIAAATGRKVSLVGWSLGGVIAREAARRAPHSIRQVVTIASPFCGNPHATNLGRIYEWLTGERVDSPAAMHRASLGPLPLPMPSSAIYSKTDGITAWQNCVAIADHQTENIEVHSSHFGMVVNPFVFHVVANRLAQPEDGWTPFSGSQNASL